MVAGVFAFGKRVFALAALSTVLCFFSGFLSGEAFAVEESWDDSGVFGRGVSEMADARTEALPNAAATYSARERMGSWVSSSGGWWYLRADGTYPAGCWEEVGGSWYLFASSGAMLTGWQEAGGSWYYLGPSGEMAASEWAGGPGAWYWLSPSGAMATGWFEAAGDWYFADASGVVQASRWVGDYYLLPSGAMAADQWVDGGRYYVGPDGR